MSNANAASLRAAFDQGFAAAPTQRPRTQDFIGFQLGAARYAIALSEVAGLFADQRIVALPSLAPGFLGVAGLRGRILPVHALSHYLDAPKSAGRWIFLAAAAEIAFCFDGFDGYLRADPADIAMNQNGNAVCGALENGARNILTLSPILSHLEKRQ